jgi:hypothetical protein
MTPKRFKALIEKQHDWDVTSFYPNPMVVTACDTGWQIIACCSYDGGYDNGWRLTPEAKGFQVVSVFVADNTGRWKIFSVKEFLRLLTRSCLPSLGLGNTHAPDKV